MRALRNKDIISILDLSREEIQEILSLTAKLKARLEKKEPFAPLAGKRAREEEQLL